MEKKRTRNGSTADVRACLTSRDLSAREGSASSAGRKAERAVRGSGTTGSAAESKKGPAVKWRAQKKRSRPEALQRLAGRTPARARRPGKWTG